MFKIRFHRRLSMRTAIMCLIGTGLMLFLTANSVWIFRNSSYGLSKSEVNSSLDNKLILLWTDKRTLRRLYCGSNVCSFTSDRQMMSKAKGIIFHVSSLKLDDFPLPRKPGQLWALFHEESPKNAVYLPYEVFLQHFNYTATFSRYSDFPLTTQWLLSLNLLTSTEYMLPVEEKSRLRKELNIAPVLFLHTLSNSMSGRDDYVRELMDYIAVDSFGGSLHNKELPPGLNYDYLNQMFSPKMLHFFANYKFILAYENAVCEDYITEKFWRPLIAGSIPVYYGSPTIQDWAPNEKSVIYINDYSSPAALADFLLKLDADDAEYNTYMDHKYNQKQPITNKRLLKLVNEPVKRQYGDYNCFLCSTMQVSPRSVPVKMASLKAYNCSFANTLPLKNIKTPLHWEKTIVDAKCTAAAVDKLLQRNIPYSGYDLARKRMELC